MMQSSMIRLPEEQYLDRVKTNVTLDEVVAEVRDGSIIEEVLHGRAASAFKRGTRGMNRTAIEKTWP